ncbi:MAG: PhnD/SsuA/transferrin family substrate-binding protein [Microvirga sp.]|nr:PhnD/SsuA/transferrin family substrate-binding protein [Microvirga sp.]
MGFEPKPSATRRAFLIGAAASLAAPSVHAAPEPFRIGLTPVFLDSDLRLTGQIEAYLTDRLARPVSLVKRRTYMEITSLLIAGHLDAAWICGLPFVQHRRALALVAAPLYRGEPTYRSLLIARKEAQAPDADALRGSVHAFSDPDSNSGQLVTRAWLVRQGEEPENFFARTFFAYGHRNVIRAVAAGLAGSGSVDSYVYEVVAEIEPDLVAATSVVRASEPMGFPPIAAPRNGDEGLRRATAEALMAMGEAPLGREILATLRLDGFAEPDPALYDGIERIARVVGVLG